MAENLQVNNFVRFKGHLGILKGLEFSVLECLEKYRLCAGSGHVLKGSHALF